MCQSADSLSTLGLNRESSERQPSATLDDVSSYSNVQRNRMGMLHRMRRGAQCRLRINARGRTKKEPRRRRYLASAQPPGADLPWRSGQPSAVCH